MIRGLHHHAMRCRDSEETRKFYEDFLGFQHQIQSMSSKIPDTLKYAKSHEWVRVEGGFATVGITGHAQHELTDIVFVELPARGRTLTAGEACGVVESVKTASDLYAPVSGEVVEANQALVEKPELLNADPYGTGWFYRVRLAQPPELTGLLSAADYAALIG